MTNCRYIPECHCKDYTSISARAPNAVRRQSKTESPILYKMKQGKQPDSNKYMLEAPIIFYPSPKMFLAWTK